MPLSAIGSVLESILGSVLESVLRAYLGAYSQAGCISNNPSFRQKHPGVLVSSDGSG